MCVVVPMAAMLGLQAASSAVGYIGQAQQANQQQRYNNDVYRQQAQQAVNQQEYNNRVVERNNEFIRQNAANTQSALNTDRAALVSQERQENIATALDIQQRRIEAIRARGAIQASERAGLTLDTLLSDFDRQESVANAISQQNLAFASGQRVREQERLTATAQSRLNQARPFEAAPVQTPYAPARVQGPSLLGSALGFASSAAGTLNTRSVYDSQQGRFKVDRIRQLPQSLPQSTRWGQATRILGGSYQGLN